MTHLEIRKNGTKTRGYIVKSSVKDGRRIREYLRPATDEEISEHLKSQRNKSKLVPVACSNPDCSNIFKIPQKQKQKFFTTFYLRYGRFTLPYCSTECRDKHLKELNTKKPKNDININNNQ